MSMQSLLKKHGVNAPRVVSATGSVMVGAAEVGLQIKRHSFHGGDDVVENPSIDWWLEGDVIERERAAMARWFPGFVEVELDEPGPPVWAGTLDTGRGLRGVLIVHRRDHGLPHVVPAKKVVGRRERGRFLSAPHTYVNGNLCVAAQEDWDPDVDDVTTVVAWAAHWYACYFDWLFLGKWPSDGVIDAA